jgi:putative transposase
MSERVKFIAAMLEAEETFGEICERFGISRKQGYKWKERYEAGGVRAPEDRSRAPHSHPHAVPAEVVLRPISLALSSSCSTIVNCSPRAVDRARGASGG